MRNSILALVVVLTVLNLFAFNWTTTPDYSGLLDEHSATEYQFTTSSDVLKARLIDFYPTDFDQIDQVDVHWGTEEWGYYYTVYGLKNGVENVQMILVSEEMVRQQTFPTRAQLGLEQDAFIIDCFWNKEVDEEGNTVRKCTVDNNRKKCGVSPSGGLCVILEEVPILD